MVKEVHLGHQEKAIQFKKTLTQFEVGSLAYSRLRNRSHFQADESQF